MIVRQQSHAATHGGTPTTPGWPMGGSASSQSNKERDSGTRRAMAACTLPIIFFVFFSSSFSFFFPFLVCPSAKRLCRGRRLGLQDGFSSTTVYAGTARNAGRIIRVRRQVTETFATRFCLTAPTRKLPEPRPRQMTAAGCGRGSRCVCPGGKSHATERASGRVQRLCAARSAGSRSVIATSLTRPWCRVVHPRMVEEARSGHARKHKLEAGEGGRAVAADPACQWHRHID